MSELLVSVRSAEEALLALEGGAAIIDVKEPSRGSLGRADDDVIAEIARVVAKRRPLSAALGEWRDENFTIPRAGLTYVKWGLAGCQRNRNWATSFNDDRPQRVFVAYADWECAAAPSIEEVFDVAAQRAGNVMLIDTHCKDANNVIRKTRPTLLDWLPVDSIVSLCDRACAAKIKIALAGSLGVAEITTLLPAQPAWFAVRGAVCDDADRNAGVQLQRVRHLVNLLQSAG